MRYNNYYVLDLETVSNFEIFSISLTETRIPKNSALVVIYKPGSHSVLRRTLKDLDDFTSMFDAVISEELDVYDRADYGIYFATYLGILAGIESTKTIFVLGDNDDYAHIFSLLDGKMKGDLEIIEGKKKTFPKVSRGKQTKKMGFGVDGKDESDCMSVNSKRERARMNFIEEYMNNASKSYLKLFGKDDLREIVRIVSKHVRFYGYRLFAKPQRFEIMSNYIDTYIDMLGEYIVSGDYDAEKIIALKYHLVGFRLKVVNADYELSPNLYSNRSRRVVEELLLTYEQSPCDSFRDRSAVAEDLEYCAG